MARKKNVTIHRLPEGTRFLQMAQNALLRDFSSEWFSTEQMYKLQEARNLISSVVSEVEAAYQPTWLELRAARTEELEEARKAKYRAERARLAELTAVENG